MASVEKANVMPEHCLGNGTKSSKVVWRSSTINWL